MSASIHQFPKRKRLRAVELRDVGATVIILPTAQHIQREPATTVINRKPVNGKRAQGRV